jgi:menaquinone-dependent protoporphyrinogen oxidase
MLSRILVTYATFTGSTAGVAEAIGKTLTEAGAQVDVLPMNAVQDLSGYSAVIAGSAIHGKQWLPEAMAWLESHRTELARKPFASFLVCITMSMKNESYRAGVKEWLEPVRRLVKPVSEGYFAGILDISKVPTLKDRLMFRISVAMGVWKEGDHRDWNAVHAWASDLAAKLA